MSLMVVKERTKSSVFTWDGLGVCINDLNILNVQHLLVF